MSTILMLSTLPLGLFAGQMKNNLVYFFVFLIMLTLLCSLAKRKWIAIIPMTLQTVMTAYFLYLNQYTESRCLLYVAAISGILMVSTCIEMLIEKKETKTA